MYITTNFKEALTLLFIIVFWVYVGLIVNDIRLKIKHKKRDKR